MRLSWRFVPMLVVVIGFAFPSAVAMAQGSAVGGDDCFALAMRHDRTQHQGKGPSRSQAEADAMKKCRATAVRPETCRIVIGTTHCNEAQQSSPTSDHRLIDDLRQKKVSVWQFGFVATVIHMLWLWHLFSQKLLPQSAKAGLGSCVVAIQVALSYVLGSDGDIALLELPIFVLPLGLGQLVASVSLKRSSQSAGKDAA